ncbi:MAG: hypothetical protein VYE40_12660 [Myxococcota bacterium]|jgi:hypothetical protein|nr:hypothetical protein [Myxococcota bacterium]MEC9441946.1 hypothetical protein [Myxococcota bacterium]
MIILLYNLPILAQAQESTPSLLDGYVEVPFAWIGAVVGVLVMVGLVYYMRRLLTDRDEDQSAREARERGQRR